MNAISKSISLIIFCSFPVFSTSIIEDIQSKQDKNPAFLIEENNPHFELAYGSNLSDSSQSMHLKILNVKGLYQSYCFNHNGLLSDGYHNQTHRLYFSDGFTPWNRLSCGFNLGTEIEKNGKDFRRNLFFDMGVLYKLTSNQIFGDHSIGVAVQNVLSTSVQRKMWHSQPVNTKVSWCADILNKRVSAGFDFYIEDCMSENPDISCLSNLGFDRYPFTVNALAGREYAGGSFGYSLVTPGLHTFSLLLQYVRNIRQHDAGRISLSCITNLERAREENYSKRMGNRGCIAPGDIYIAGVNYYNNTDYFNALGIFHEMSKYYPDSFKKEWYTFFIVDSYYRLGMLKTAKWKALGSKDVFVSSHVYPFITLTLLRIAKEEHSEEDIKKYQRMFQDSIKKNDSLKQEADFLVAEYKFITKDFLSALNDYSKLKPGHPLYRVAQYSMASIYFYQKNQSKLNEVISVLQNHKTDINIDQINRLRSITPIMVEKFKIIEDSIKNERVKIQREYDSLGFTMDSVLDSNYIGKGMLKMADSLHVIQRRGFEIIEKDRLLQNTLYKKWQILGNELLKYLNKNELDVLEKCCKIIDECN